MLFGLLFVMAFLFGVSIYHFTRQWLIAVSVPTGLYLISVLLDSGFREAWMFSIFFGLPIMFVGALLGAYVYQIRFIDILEIDMPSSEIDDSDEPIK